MMSFGPNVDPIVGFSLHVDSKYFSVAVLTWVVHEIVITTGDAVNLFWMQRWSISKLFFFVNRFAAVFTAITMTALNLVAFDSNYPCAVLTGCMYVGNSLIFLTEAFMLSSRVWALWRGSHIILTIFFLTVAADLCNYLFTFGIGLLKGTILLNQSPYTGCFVIPGYGSMWVGVGLCLVYETFAIGLIICKPLLIRRATGIKTPLFTMLFHDGLAHYLIFLSAKLFNVGGIVVPTVVAAVALPASLPIILVTLTANRLFLRLRRTMLNERAGLTEFNTAGPSTIGFGTGGGDDDGSEGITTIGGSDKAKRRIHAQSHSHLDDEAFSPGGGDIEMFPSKKDGELYPIAPTRRGSAIPPTPTASGSLSNMDVSVLGSNPHHAV